MSIEFYYVMIKMYLILIMKSVVIPNFFVLQKALLLSLLKMW